MMNVEGQRIRFLLTALCYLLSFPNLVNALSLPRNNVEVSRSDFVKKASGGLGMAALTGFVSPLPSSATELNKRTNLSIGDVKDIVKGDVIDRQFLATAKLTRDIWDESALFIDEIDTYGLQQWVTGTQRLFVGSGSNVRLLGDVESNADETEIKFRFEEELMFNIPLVRPVVFLSGTVYLSRNPETGLLTKYVEKWDQSVSEVLKSASPFGKN